MDFWKYKGVSNNLKRKVCGSLLEPKHTSLELIGEDGKIKDGWKWAEEALISMGE